MIINLRGTSGSGKSFLARRLLALYPERVANYADGRSNPISYICTGVGRRPLYVLGHYEAEWGGGADTVKRADGFPLLTEAAKLGCDLLWEGVIFSDEVPNTLMLSRQAPTHVIFLTTPMQQCLDDINARRQQAGNVKPLNPANTVNRQENLDRVYKRLRLSQAPGLKVYKLDREAAYAYCVELLTPQENLNAHSLGA